MSSATTSTSGFDVRYRTIDLVTITTLAVAFGVIFWGWGKIYEPLSSGATVAYPPTAALFGGVWLSAGVVGGLIVRKPGAAFATEFLAAAADAKETAREPVPLHLRNAITNLMKAQGYGAGYAYAHSDPAAAEEMECLPESLHGRKYWDAPAGEEDDDHC